MEQSNGWTRATFVVGTLLSIGAFYLGWQTHQTSRALQRIEEARLSKEKRDAEVADFIGSFYAAQCDQQIAMERFPLKRWVGIQTPVDRDYVQRECDRARGDEPTRVIERLDIVGRLGSDKVRVFATVRWAKDGRPLNDTGELSYVDLSIERERPSSPFPYAVRSVAEVKAHAS